MLQAAIGNGTESRGLELVECQSFRSSLLGTSKLSKGLFPNVTEESRKPIHRWEVRLSPVQRSRVTVSLSDTKG